MTKFKIAFALLFLFSTITLRAQTTHKDDAALTALVVDMANAQVTFDIPTLDRVLTADYIEISPLGEFDPRDKVLGFYKVDAKPNAIPALEVSDFSIRSYGKFAIVIAKLTYKTSPASPGRSIRATFACRREKGDWKIASTQYTGIRPAAPKT
jgi:hypothetical protein